MDVDKLIQHIPNNVSGDGKPFVAALKKALIKYKEDLNKKIDDSTSSAGEKPGHVSSVQLLELHSINDGVRINSIQVSWVKTTVTNYAKAEVWFRTATDKAWEKAGESSGTQFVYSGATTGLTYYIKVVAVNTKGNTADFDTAPQASIKIQGSQYIPNPPTQFVLTWDEKGPLWKWLFEPNEYIDFFELRLDQNPGVWNDKRLDSTRETWSRANPGVRSGTAYLYIRNIFGEYSEPAVHEFNKAMGGKPATPILTATLDGVNVKMADLPLGYTHYKLHIVTSDGEDDYYTTSNSEYIYFFFSGTITVSYCFVDDISDGEWSDTVQADVKTLMVNAENIADNAVTAAKIRANSIDASKIQAGAVTADKIEAGAITAEKLAADSVTSDAIQAGSVIGDKIAANTITGKHFAAANIDLTGALTITGGNVKLSQEGLRLTGNDNSYTLFNGEGINYVDKNGITYAQVKKMIIGKAYDGQRITFAAPWAKPPSVLTVPMSIQVNLPDYTASELYLICEATEVSETGFIANSYLKLLAGSYAVNGINRKQQVQSTTVESMTNNGYGGYTYTYTITAYEDLLKTTIPNTANNIEFSLQATITNNNLYDASEDSRPDWKPSNWEPGYPGANTGITGFDNIIYTVTVQLLIDDSVSQEVSFNVNASSKKTIKNFLLSSSFKTGKSVAKIRVKFTAKLRTYEHAGYNNIWEENLVYKSRQYIADSFVKNSTLLLENPYYKYEAETGKVARGYCMFLVTDGSTNTYTITDT